MATLHIVSSSPFGDSRLDSCLRALGKEDALLLCGEAVQALRSGTAPEARLRALSEGQLYALHEDCLARGLTTALASSVDYPAFVALTLAYDRVNSWL